MSLEALEGRRLLAADVMGDSNFNGTFDSGDLVAVFQAGKFETNEQATWSQGDWNNDGRFDSGDLVAAFQQGSYGREPLAANADAPVGAAEGEANPQRGAGPRGERQAQRQDADPELAAERITDLIAGLKEDGPPEGVSQEDFDNAIATAESALADGDFDGVREALRSLRGDDQRRGEGERPERSDRPGRRGDRQDRPADPEAVAEIIAGLKEDGPSEGVSQEDFDNAIAAAEGALAEGDLDGVRAALRSLRGERERPEEGARSDRGREADPEAVAERVAGVIAGLKEDGPPEGISQEDFDTAIATAETALAEGNLEGVREALRSLRGEGERGGPEGPRRGGRPGRGDQDRPVDVDPVAAAERAAGLIAELKENGPQEGVSQEDFDAAITAAEAALADGNLEGVRDALRSLRGETPERKGPRGGGRPGRGGGRQDGPVDMDPIAAAERIAGRIAELKEAGPPEGINQEDFDLAIAAAETALAEGDFDAVREALGALRGEGERPERGGPQQNGRPDREGGRPDGPMDPAAAAERVAGRIAELKEAGPPEGMSQEDFDEAIANAEGALAEGNLQAVREALSIFHTRENDGRPNRDMPENEQPEIDPNGGPPEGQPQGEQQDQNGRPGNGRPNRRGPGG